MHAIFPLLTFWIRCTIVAFGCTDTSKGGRLGFKWLPTTTTATVVIESYHQTVRFSWDISPPQDRHSVDHYKITTFINVMDYVSLPVRNGVYTCNNPKFTIDDAKHAHYIARISAVNGNLMEFASPIVFVGFTHPNTKQFHSPFSSEDYALGHPEDANTQTSATTTSITVTHSPKETKIEWTFDKTHPLMITKRISSYFVTIKSCGDPCSLTSYIEPSKAYDECTGFGCTQMTFSNVDLKRGRHYLAEVYPYEGLLRLHKMVIATTFEVK